MVESMSKPMRIRAMELPGEVNPETQQISVPFVIILDRIPKDRAAIVDQLGEHPDGERLRDLIGARAILFFDGEVQIGEDF